MVDQRKILSLRGKNNVDHLFNTGKSIFKYPFKIIYLSSANDSDPSMFYFTVTVSKRNLKKAVDRNKIKRRTREAIRHNLPLFDLDSDKDYQVVCMYIAKEVLDYQVIEKSIKWIGSKLM